MVDEPRLNRRALRSERLTWNRLTVFFGISAVAARLVFWLYTGRVWEDSLVTAAAARNFWLGNGPVAHTGEAPVQSFSSPMGLFVDCLGQAFGHGLLAIRLASLVCSALTIVLAARIASRLGVKPWAAILLLAFLAFDQLQIMFGMAGMETQVATTVILACWYLLLLERWSLLFFMTGVAVLSRPEFLIWSASAIALICWWKPEARRRAWLAGVLLIPWLVTMYLWTGEIIPNTITAKSLYPWSGLQLHTMSSYRSYLGSVWKMWSPFRSYNFTVSTPFPPFLLELTGLLFFALAALGAIRVVRRNPLAAWPSIILVGLFIAYEVGLEVPPYFMWYWPPICAIMAVFGSVMLSELSLPLPRTSVVLGCAMGFLYAVHMPFTFPLEKTVQNSIEDRARVQIGLYLGRTMSSRDTVVLEPPGFIGWYAENKILYDYPGLTSSTVVRVLKSVPRPDRQMELLVDRLSPTFVVFRTSEYQTFIQTDPSTAKHYRQVGRFSAAPGLTLRQWGVQYFNIDTDFVVLRRTS